MMKISRFSSTLITIALLTLTASVSLAAWNISYLQSVKSIKQDLRDSLLLTQSALQAEIERFRYLPFVIAQDRRINDILNSPYDRDKQQKANAYLKTIQINSNADKLYVLNEKGTTLASSNWDEPLSFVGKNYGFRPYFQKALTSRRGRFYAVGVTTGKAGYFLSSLILTPEGKRGVAVVKVDLTPLEQTWRKAAISMTLFDDNGVVILSGNKNWKYRPVYKLNDWQVQKIVKDKTYPIKNLIDAKPLFYKINNIKKGLPEKSFISSSEKPDLVVSLPIKEDGWRLFATKNLSIAMNTSKSYAVLVGLCGLLMSVGYFYLRQRHQFIQFKLKQNCILEKKVEERTRALESEIEVRTLAEQELVRTQENLVQNAKLAVLGRMSTAIVHEISQPLSAMDTILATAQANHGNQSYDSIASNLNNSRGMVTRIKRTIKHLKTFSKPEKANFEQVDLVKAISAALELAEPRIKETGVTVHFDSNQQVATIMANFLRIEQVILNLLLNAVEATEQCKDGKVDINIIRQGSILRVLLSDNGIGIDKDILGHMTEPFVSTKATAGGLGLGLSISRTIIEEYEGKLDFEKNNPKGTIAIINFPGYPDTGSLNPGVQ